MTDKENNVRHFLEMIKKSRRGKFKIYIGMSAGVGKTYRMLQEAHALLRNGIDVKIGYIETHDRERNPSFAGRITGDSTQTSVLQRKRPRRNGFAGDH